MSETSSGQEFSFSAVERQVLCDADRLAALEQTGLLDSPCEASFDRLTRLACNVLGAPTALVSLVDQNRQFFKSQVALPEPFASCRQTPLSHSFCRHVVSTGEPLIIDNAPETPLVQDNLAIPELGVVAYAGIPLTTPEGYTLGSFCVIDNQPRQWTEEEIAILRDLAGFVMTEIELRRTTNELEANYQQIHAAQVMRDSLTNMIVHDLRTPLTSIIMGLKLAPGLGTLNDAQQDCFSAALRGTNALLGMINDMLDINKMEAGALQLNCTPVSVAALIHDALDQLMPLAQGKGLLLRLELPFELPVFEADEDLLRRTIINLVGNAVKFTPRAGAITISACLEGEVSPAECEDDSPSDPPAILVSVADTGEGIPRDAFESIFDKFGQVQSRKAGHKMSTGLGLTFCKMAVEAHGGRIWVESTVGQGSTFSFRIPLAR